MLGVLWAFYIKNTKNNIYKFLLMIKLSYY